MDRLRICGGTPLQGEITIGGAKNAALPLMCLSLLTNSPLVLQRMPLGLADVRLMRILLGQIGVTVSILGPQTLELHLQGKPTTTAQYDIVEQMRASVLVLGPLVSRHGYARISLPGGCAIGERPVDMHIDALQAMGADIHIRHGYIEASAPRSLTGCDINFAKVSVGATENVLSAATLAKGKTRIINAAQEPEIITLAECLRAMGAKIEGEGTSVIEIEGVDELSGTEWLNIQDRLEVGSMMIAFAATSGTGKINYDTRQKHMTTVVEKLIEAGVSITEMETGFHISADSKNIKPTSIETQPYPGFPTDLQAQWMAWMTRVPGKTKISETIFENRFRHVAELRRLGAKIAVDDRIATVDGVNSLSGAAITATDIRASMGLIIAGLCAEGETVINDLRYLDRGYERVELKLAAIGATISRESDTGSVDRQIA